MNIMKGYDFSVLSGSGVWIGVRKSFQNLLKRVIYPKSAKTKNKPFQQLNKNEEVRKLEGKYSKSPGPCALVSSSLTTGTIF